MRVLLDTCTFLWLALDPDRISDPAKTLLDEEATIVGLSQLGAARIWEGNPGSN